MFSQGSHVATVTPENSELANFSWYQQLMDKFKECYTQAEEDKDSITKCSEAEAFDKEFTRFRRDLLKHIICEPAYAIMSPDHLETAVQYFDRVVMNNVPNGKRERGLCVVDAFKTFADPSAADYERKVVMARQVGWCAELFQAFGLMIDDIQDSSTVRSSGAVSHAGICK